MTQTFEDKATKQASTLDKATLELEGYLKLLEWVKTQPEDQRPIEFFKRIAET